MTQPQWKLPGLCLCPAAEKEKEHTWGNKGMIMERKPVCGSRGTGVHVRHWGLARHGHSAIPEPDWVQIKSCFIISMKGKEWAEMANNLFGGNISKENHIKTAFRELFPLSWVHLVGYIKYFNSVAKQKRAVSLMLLHSVANIKAIMVYLEVLEKNIGCFCEPIHLKVKFELKGHLDTVKKTKTSSVCLSTITSGSIKLNPPFSG